MNCYLFIYKGNFVRGGKRRTGVYYGVNEILEQVKYPHDFQIRAVSSLEVETIVPSANVATALTSDVCPKREVLSL